MLELSRLRWASVGDELDRQHRGRDEWVELIDRPEPSFDRGTAPLTLGRYTQ